MAVADGLLSKVDTVLDDIFAGWSLSTTLIATLLFLFLAYPWLTWKDPDIHPFLLARQATASPVRQPGESATYRCNEVPYGYPLRSGLNIKDPGTPKWSSGRNGDLRDIWIQAVNGLLKDDGSSSGPKGKLLTVLGRESVVERSLESASLEINVIGQYLSNSQCKRVAICLSNSVELLVSIFAASFYGVHPILLPHDSSTDTLIKDLQKAEPDFLIAEAGTLEVESVVSECQNLSEVIWVTKAGNVHMHFAETPDTVGGKVRTSTWHDLVQEYKSSSNSDLPSIEKGSPGPSLSIVESTKNGSEIVEYTSGNIIAAIAALIAALPPSQRLGRNDTILPIAPLTSSYPLTLTLAALFSHSTIALNSVAGENVDFALATSSLSPTIIIASSQSTLQRHRQLIQTQHGLLPSLSRYLPTQSLLKGAMPAKNAYFSSISPSPSPSTLRLLFTYHRAATDSHSPRLSPTLLHDLRLLLGTRTCYALTAPGVVGAVTQTNPFDYGQAPGSESHFGPPLSSVEVLLLGEEEKLSGREPTGKVVVRGPAVCGGERMLGVVGRIGENQTLSLG